MDNKLYVCGFMFSPDRKQVLLINKLRPDWQNGKINGIGGKVEIGETPIEAMIREFSEETGKLTTVNDWRFVFSLSSDTAYTDNHKYKVFFFSSFLGFHDTFNKTDETVLIIDIKKLPNNVLPNLNWIIPMLLDDDVSNGRDLISNNDNEWNCSFLSND